ncbi:SOS response-associated peptidase family protein [Lacinutrix himadriensis]|uniref:SOS response-associated peptidase family protein n=1 Tax=Lacinutrix himadriensis TaxID=641549 RepID=UPI0006E3D036|nr:SOS response-associated peptidase family protein [Lacinutrix himadriensis]
MFYKLRNTASLKQIEQELNTPFAYPKLYRPIKVLNGFKEVSLPIITMEKPKVIDFSIWGLLPTDFEENWSVFQNISNTLNVDIQNINEEDPFLSEALNKRRCLIIVTGFYTTYISNGKIKSFHVFRKNNLPFCLAGIYNELADGFKTCSVLITTNTNSKGNAIPSFSIKQPLVLKKKYFDYWLAEDNSFCDLKSLVKDLDTYTFESEVVDQKTLDPSEVSNNPF